MSTQNLNHPCVHITYDYMFLCGKGSLDNKLNLWKLKLSIAIWPAYRVRLGV